MCTPCVSLLCGSVHQPKLKQCLVSQMGIPVLSASMFSSSAAFMLQSPPSLPFPGVTLLTIAFFASVVFLVSLKHPWGTNTIVKIQNLKAC